MEREIEYLRAEIENFCKRYNVMIEVDTCHYGWTTDGRIASPKAKIIIRS